MVFFIIRADIHNLKGQSREMTFKGQYIEKIKWGTINWTRKNIFLLFFQLSFKKLLSAYIENKLNGGKSRVK
jgi:hypothetical protein